MDIQLDLALGDIYFLALKSSLTLNEAKNYVKTKSYYKGVKDEDLTLHNIMTKGKKVYNFLSQSEIFKQKEEDYA